MNLYEKTKLKAEGSLKSSKCCGDGQMLLGILCFFLPPLAVAIHSGFTKDLLINLVLFFLGWLPGVFHGWYVVLGEKYTRRLAWSFLAVILPPLVIALKQGIHQTFLINVLLTILGWFPGVVHAWYIIWTYKSARMAGIS